MNREKLFSALDDDELVARAEYERKRASEMQRQSAKTRCHAITAQRNYSAAARELARRARAVECAS